jgi:hypothetical protein
VLDVAELNYHGTRKRSVICIKLTDLQYAEIILRWNIYSKALRKEKDFLIRAFFAKHKIYSNKPSNKSSSITEEERYEIYKKAAAMDDIVIPGQLNGRLLGNEKEEGNCECEN